MYSIRKMQDRSIFKRFWARMHLRCGVPGIRAERLERARDGEKCRHGILTVLLVRTRVWTVALMFIYITSGLQSTQARVSPDLGGWHGCVKTGIEAGDGGFMAPQPHGLQRDTCIAGLFCLLAVLDRFSVTSARFATCWHKRSGVCVWT